MSIKNKEQLFNLRNVRKSIINVEKDLQTSLEGTVKWDFGCFYTPDFIATYMIENAILKRLNYLRKNQLNLKVELASLEDFIAFNNPEQAKLMLETILPSFRICDISMGWGVFLLKGFDVLYQLYRNCTNVLKKEQPEEEHFIVYSILKNNIFGVDLSNESLKLANLKLIEKAFHYLQKEEAILPVPHLAFGNSLLGFTFKDFNKKTESNFVNLVSSKFKGELTQDVQNYLLSNFKQVHWSEVFPNVKRERGFDIIIGNPPYINVKRINPIERKIYSKLFSTYNSNGDLSNIFWERSINLCKPGGIVSFITPRYWIEGSDSSGLRRLLLENSTIFEIIDFRSNRTLFNETEFKLGVDTAIVTIGKRPLHNEVIQVYISNHNNKVTSIDKGDFKHVKFPYSNLTKKKWIFEKTSLISEIENNCHYRLGDDKKDQQYEGICHIGKGCSTGNNKIFSLRKIGDYSYQGANGINLNLNEKEKKILRLLIKNSDINRFNWKQRDQYWIYLRNENIQLYPNLQSYLESFRHILESSQKKYGLQNYYDYVAYRSLPLIESKTKILCPYQANMNKFALVSENSPPTIYEADIITLVIKDEFLKDFNWFYLLGILNSELIQYYTKIMNKKVYNLYDFRTNQLKHIPLMKSDMMLPFQVISEYLVYLLSKNGFQKTSESNKMVETMYNILNLLVYEEYYQNLLSSELRDYLGSLFEGKQLTKYPNEFMEIILNLKEDRLISKDISKILSHPYILEIKQNLS